MRFSDPRSGMLRQPDNGAGSGGTPDQRDSGTASGANSFDVGTGGMPNPEGQPVSTETWYGGLDAASKSHVDNYVKERVGQVNGLKTALNKERAALTEKIEEIKKAAEKGSELERQLADMQNTIALTERRAAFVEDAIRPEVGCTNVKAAYALAVSENYFDSRGRTDWNALKAAAPELFRKPGPGSVDGGAGNNQSPKLDMNMIIRRAAGRG